ncbi:MAG: LLM class flavin-dependent oxidoreductase [Candidatus Nitrosopolaris sp.]
MNPIDLLDDVVNMGQNRIERCWTSDHYMPWWNSGASGGAARPWLGAALAKTTKIVIGTGVTAPILRYHPAIVAQVFAHAWIYVSEQSISRHWKRRSS